MKKVVLGISGGVDSAVAALLLKEQGYEITGLYLKSSLTKDESEAARECAEKAGIGYDCMDISRELEQYVCRPFFEDYCRGMTPSPCIVCNPTVKFASLFSYADRIGAEYVATGHYASVGKTETGETAIFKGIGRCDQSYMLCRLDPTLYPRLIFPLGGFSKPRIREIAEKAGLSVSQKPDSMEICFIPDGDRIGFLEKRMTGTEKRIGNFIDGDGKILGPHEGIHRYTVGQRKRLGIALGYPVYVSAINPETNEITLLPSGGEYNDTVTVEDCMWFLNGPDRFEADIRVRHSEGFTRGTVENRGKTALLRFPQGVRAPAPGQYAVFYVNGAIAGSGRIIRS